MKPMHKMIAFNSTVDQSEWFKCDNQGFRGWLGVIFRLTTVLFVAIHFILAMVYSKINKVKVFLHESDYSLNYKQIGSGLYRSSKEPCNVAWKYVLL